MTHLILQFLKLAVVGGALVSRGAIADTTTLAGSPFVQALKDGKAIAPPPANPLTTQAIKALQERTRNQGEVTMLAFRMVRFKSQPKCGRVAFGLYQENTKTFWGRLGGQINVCEDGTPPLKICRATPSQLVLHNHECVDKSHPVDTTEVSEAIKKALASGSMTIDQFRDSMNKASPKASIGASR